MSTEQQFLEEEKEVPQRAKEYEEQIIKAINEIAEIAFNIGIEIPEIIIKDTWFQVGLPYGNKHIIPAPKLTKIDTDFGTIKVKKL